MTSKLEGSGVWRAILVVVATAATITYNGLAAAGHVNGVTPEVISDKYPTVVTPAGFAFSIWSLIYVGLIAFSIYQLMPSQRERFSRIRTLFLISCLLNCAWIFFWHHDQVVICFLLIASLLGVLVVILRRSQAHGLLDTTMTKGVFGIYAGWITAASLSNFAIALKASGIDAGTGVWNAIGVLFLMFAVAAAVIVRLKLRNFLYPVAIAWAATAIGVKQSGNTPIVLAAAICVIVGLVLAVSFVMDDQKAVTE